jgi:hypothetical protein
MKRFSFEEKLAESYGILDKWIASDIPCGLASGLESEYNEKKYASH